MVNFHDLAANLNMGYMVAIGIVFGALIGWVGWSVMKLIINFFRPKEKEKIEA